MIAYPTVSIVLEGSAPAIFNVPRDFRAVNAIAERKTETGELKARKKAWWTKTKIGVLYRMGRRHK